MKLPINPLLYLLSLACASGIVLNIMGTVRPRWPYDRTKEAEIRKGVTALMERGSKELPDIGQWRYDATNPFWEQFKSANFTGYRAPEPVPKGPDEPKTTPTGGTDVDLRLKIDVVCISYGGDYTRAVVQYLDLAVEVPEEERPPAPGPGDIARPVAPPVRGRRGPPAPVVPQLPNTAPLHRVGLGDHLWPPFDNFYLVEVADDARSVFFENRAKDKVEGRHPRQELIKKELGLPDAVARELVRTARAIVRTGPEAKTTPAPGRPASQWQDLPETKAIRENEWNVSRKDLDYINQRGNKFIHEDVRLNDYSGGTGKNRVQGVSVNRLGRRAQGLGVNEGDVLTSLNGVQVRNRAHAISVGKRLWRKGVRTFKAVFLRRGREITITHHFPDK